MKTLFKKIIVLVIVCLLLLVGFTNTNIEVEALYPTARIEEDLPIVYRQNDYRWNYHVHGGGTIGGSACGLLSITNAVNYLNGNFIAPLELADYAYSIEAYNTPEGGGTWRYVLYRQLDCFETKYGFQVSNPGTEKPLDDSCKEHLKKGNGAIIALVPGHFIALVEYDETTNSYLVYDSAADATNRHTYYRGTWITEAELSGDIPKLKVQWYCFIKNTIKRDTKLDGWTNETNGRADATYTISYSERSNNLPISGYAADSREIINYYYTLDYQTTKYALTPYEREEDIDSSITYDPSLLGFKGSINTTNLSMGTHYAYVCGETKNGGVCTIAEIQIRITDGEAIDTTNRTFTVDMSSSYAQPDVVYDNKTYTYAGSAGTVDDLGKINLANFKYARIYYSTSANFDSDQCGITSVIGLKKTNNYFGYAGLDLNLNSCLGYEEMKDGSIASTGTYATIDLSNTTYNGRVYLSGYNQEGQLYYVSKVVFYYNDDYDLTYHHSETNQVLSSTPYYLGQYNLNNQPYLTIKTNGNNLNPVTVTAIDANNQVLGSCVINNDYDKNVLLLNVDATANVYLIASENLAFSDISMASNNAIKSYNYTDENHHQVLVGMNQNNQPIYQSCSHLVYDTSISPDCLNTGYNKSECLICKHILSDEVVPALGHDFSDLQNDDQHYQMCSRCMIFANYENHTYTLKSDSKYHYEECTCGYTINYELHTYEEVDGEYKCTVCGAICTHEKVRTTIGTEPTCTTDGISGVETCKSCGKVVKEATVLSALGHEYVDGFCIWCNEAEPVDEPTNNDSCSNSSASIAIILFVNSLAVIGIFKSKKIS